MIEVPPTQGSGYSAAIQNPDQLKADLLLNQLGSEVADYTEVKSATDFVDVGMDQVYKSLTVLADEIVAKLEEVLGESLPEGGLKALNPEDHTPEATSQRIVDGVAGLFGVFAAQNPELSDEELVTSFMETVKKGVDEGYQDAIGILGDLGAFEFDGVKAGIEKTMELVNEKLGKLEQDLRARFGTGEDSDTASSGEQVGLSADGNTQTLAKSSQTTDEINVSA